MNEDKPATVSDSGAWLGSQLETPAGTPDMGEGTPPDSHDPERDIDRRITVLVGTITVAAAIVAAVMAVKRVPTAITIATWQAAAIVLAWGLVCFVLGVALMAAVAMAGRADDEMAAADPRLRVDVDALPQWQRDAIRGDQ